jgi:hypothetical protein
MSETETATMVPDYLMRKTTRVRIFTSWGVVEGGYATPPGVLLSNALRNASSSERYLILTDATFRTFAGTEMDPDVAAAPFVLVNPAQASAIIPLEADSEMPA